MKTIYSEEVAQIKAVETQEEDRREKGARSNSFDSGQKGEQDYRQQTSLVDLALNSSDLLLLHRRSIGIEAAQLLRLLPRQHTVCPSLVLGRWHYVFLDGRDIVEVCLHGRRARIDHLDYESIALAIITIVYFLAKALSRAPAHPVNDTKAFASRQDD